MKLEGNGFGSRGEKSRHIHIRYFYIRDVLKREEILLRHCKTERMVADYFTKPLQGKLFKIIRDYIMGISEIPIEERVETDTNVKKYVSENMAIGPQGSDQTKEVRKTYAQILTDMRRRNDVRGKANDET